MINALSREVVNGVWKIRLNSNISRYDFKLHIIIPEINKADVSGSANVTVTEPVSGDGSFSTKVSGSRTIDISGFDDVFTTMNVDVSGSGSALIDDITVRNLSANVSGSGNVQLQGMSSTFTARVSGSGNISDYNLISSDVDAQSSGSGSISFTCNDKLYAKVSGSGNILYKGNPTDVQTEVSGSGKIQKVD
ncbi:GIN domain-containing protein [Flammeovirga sp. SJP92]|uniref:GIN domain-containing protein n=1 Tax=Flammeovirga sp. SJP92 TaxID=1775430 RepID=UPI0007896B92|nr:DUF2807 domain-containing protein [Flammeovirga sp. SJP92]KXX67721.1 hypothetical protein AVL50_24955 [Flammeovirga sp. SJP92]